MKLHRSEILKREICETREMRRISENSRLPIVIGTAVGRQVTKKVQRTEILVGK
jgi:hypothetical protein